MVRKNAQSTNQFCVNKTGVAGKKIDGIKGIFICDNINYREIIQNAEFRIIEKNIFIKKGVFDYGKSKS